MRHERFRRCLGVLINTRSGACDPSLRYGLEISGVVHNSDSAPIAMSGRVVPSGAVQVSGVIG
jgi:hypothetical protein